MNTYCILHRPPGAKPTDDPVAFTCHEKGAFEAARCLTRSFPDSEVVWVYLQRDIREEAMGEWRLAKARDACGPGGVGSWLATWGTAS